MIDLTTDFGPGDDHTDGPYTHANCIRVLQEDIPGKVLIVEVAYGTKPASVFVQSGYPPKAHTISAAAYDTMDALATNNPETFGAARDRLIHQTLLDVGAYAGTLV